MLFKTGKTGVKSLVNILNSAVKGVTSKNLINKVIGKNANKLLKKLGRFVARIPLAGGLFAYVFVQSGKGLVIITTTADKLVDSSGKVVITALGGAKKLSVWTLDTIKGVATKFTKGVTRRRKKKRKSSKSKTRRKGRKRSKRKRK
tara:strand:+ start:20 stop:457 length:438 start_codon:yes stop_codon:yes gene_type:complete